MSAAAIIPAILGSVASAVVGSVFQEKPKEPQAPQTPKVPEAPQAAQAPTTAQAARTARQAAFGGYGGSRSSTELTGPGGIDTAALNLGKNTLLGA